ncbi:MAG: DUF2958 domain-containing protein [Verrucomicrobiaceae bacterium]|nr:MAG: DUF2958 domain-containing protein [Verrucomicrobiaceae bacterium]
MKLITDEIRAALLANGAASEKSGGSDDHKPVVKLFTPDGGATWLITEMDPEEPDILFGLCDLGIGFPELGSVRLSEIESISGAAGLKVERDLHFQAKHPISVYADIASDKGSIVA